MSDDDHCRGFFPRRKWARHTNGIRKQRKILEHICASKTIITMTSTRTKRRKIVRNQTIDDEFDSYWLFHSVVFANGVLIDVHRCFSMNDTIQYLTKRKAKISFHNVVILRSSIIIHWKFSIKKKHLRIKEIDE